MRNKTRLLATWLVLGVEVLTGCTTWRTEGYRKARHYYIKKARVPTSSDSLRPPTPHNDKKI